MKSILLSLLTGIFLNSCNSNSEDLQFKEDFLRKIDKIGCYSPKSAVDNDFVITSAYLYQITGQPPKCEIKTHSCFFDFKDSVFYAIMSYQEDKEYWLSWYKKHNSDIDFQYADSIYQQIKEKVLKDSLYNSDDKVDVTEEISDSITELLDEAKEQNQSVIMFQQFLEKFSSDSAFQINHTLFPFKIASYDIEDNMDTSLISQDKWQFLNLQYDSIYAKREVNAYTQNIDVFQDSCIVSYKGIDNGIWIDYVFVRQYNDWMLSKEVDYSN